MSAPVDVLAELTPEQAHEMAPKSFSWDEAGAWAMGWKACCEANRAAVAELVEAAKAFVNDDRQGAWHVSYRPKMDALAAALARVGGAS